MTKRLLVGSTAVTLLLLGACNAADLPEAQQEVKDHNIKLDLPAVPTFELPQPNADGTHPVDEMRLRGKRYLGQTVQIKGFVISIYDCATAIRTGEMTQKEAEKKIEDEPTLCTRPNFYLGMTANAAVDRGVRVVENPRPPRKDELKNDKDNAKLMMEAYKLVPKFKIGDEVVVTGKWVTKSPRGFRDSNGLLVFESLVNKSAPAEPEK